MKQANKWTNIQLQAYNNNSQEYYAHPSLCTDNCLNEQKWICFQCLELTLQKRKGVKKEFSNSKQAWKECGGN